MKQPHPVQNIIYGSLFLCLVVMLVAGVWYGTRVSALTITDIQVRGGKTINHEVVHSAAEAELTGTYLGLIPKRFAWLYPRSRVVAAVQAIERVDRVELSRNERTLEVYFTEHVPQALWCEAVGSDRCLFLDEHGLAFAPAPALRGGALVRYVTIGRELARGEQLASTDDMVVLFDLRRSLVQAGWLVHEIELDHSRDAYLHLARGGELKITLDQSPTETLDNLRVIRESDNFSHITPGNFAYIDLRFGNKVFVNEVGAQASSSIDAI